MSVTVLRSGTSQFLRIPDVAALLLCLISVGFLVTSAFVHSRRVAQIVSPLSASDPQEPALSGHGFAQNAVYGSTPLPPVSGDIKLYGSWLGTDQSVGSVHTAWYRATPRFFVFVAGYPAHTGNRLFIQLQTANSGVIDLPISFKTAPGESWMKKEITFSASDQAAVFRIVGIDGSRTAQGWLGFSQPFLISGEDRAEDVKELFFVLFETATAIAMLLAPGLLLRQKLLESGRRLAFIWVPVPGILALAILGVVAWKGPHSVSPVLISRLVLLLLALYSTYRFARVPISTVTSLVERRVLLAVVVLIFISVGKATYSVSPVGELYATKISRSLEVGSRSDSRISYHVVQLVATRRGANSGLARTLFGPWSFSDRGPVAGLAASPLVLASPVKVTDQVPDQPWSVFDPEGFSAYRIAMIVIASSGLISVFGLASVFLPEQWTLLAFLTAATAPFVVHETYFTWPKLVAASFVLLAAYCVLKRRYLIAGLSLGLGYLCHPSALMSFPALVALIVLSAPSKADIVPLLSKLRHYVVASLWLIVGMGFWLLFWRVVNAKHFAQTGFLIYFFEADGVASHSFAIWLHARWDSLLNTLVPLNLFVFHRNNRELNSLSGASPAVIQFFQQYWDALPFGAGIAFFFCSLRILYSALRTAFAWVLWILVVPLAAFTIYWGGATTGMLREGLHAWFLGLMLLIVVVWKNFTPESDGFWRICSWALLFRGVEILCLCLLPAVLSRRTFFQTDFLISDIVSMLMMIAGTTWLCIYTFRQSEFLRKECLGGRDLQTRQRHWLGMPTPSHSPQLRP